MTPPGAEFRIRSVSTADLAAVAALEVEAFDSPWSAEDLARFWAAPGAIGWLAEDAQGSAIGFALFRVVAAAQEAELLRVGTAPAWQRRSVGTGLVSAALAELDRRSFDSYLEVRADNLPAQSLYLRLGFERVGRRTGYYGDGGDAWLYARKGPART